MEHHQESFCEACLYGFESVVYDGKAMCGPSSFQKEEEEVVIL